MTRLFFALSIAWLATVMGCGDPQPKTSEDVAKEFDVKTYDGANLVHGFRSGMSVEAAGQLFTELVGAIPDVKKSGDSEQRNMEWEGDATPNGIVGIIARFYSAGLQELAVKYSPDVARYTNWVAQEGLAFNELGDRVMFQQSEVLSVIYDRDGSGIHFQDHAITHKSGVSSETSWNSVFVNARGHKTHKGHPEPIVAPPPKPRPAKKTQADLVGSWAIQPTTEWQQKNVVFLKTQGAGDAAPLLSGSFTKWLQEEERLIAITAETITFTARFDTRGPDTLAPRRMERSYRVQSTSATTIVIEVDAKKGDPDGGEKELEDGVQLVKFQWNNEDGTVEAHSVYLGGGLADFYSVVRKP